MLFKGIAKEFSLIEEEQYQTIGKFWDEMALIYGLESLQGLGYKWENNKIYYAIGLKDGVIEDYNFNINLPDNGWIVVEGKTDNLKDIYDEIYKDGPLKFEIEMFNEDGTCKIYYFRNKIKL